jgi:hypothetical protein
MTGSARWRPSPRRQRRDQLLLAGLVPSLAALLVAVLLLSGLVRNERGLAAWAAGEEERARDLFAANRWAGMIEPWVAAFNEGGGHYAAGEYAAAVADLRAALRDVPAERECLVRLNLALARERLGDQRRERGHHDTAARAAEELWRDARDALAGGRCTTAPVPRADGDDPDRPAWLRHAQETDARLAVKVEASQRRRLDRLLAGLPPEQQRRARELEEVNQEAAETEAKDPPAPATGPEGDGSTYSW